jgi:uncharacterized protein (TIGR03118 family)
MVSFLLLRIPECGGRKYNTEKEVLTVGTYQSNTYRNLSALILALTMVLLSGLSVYAAGSSYQQHSLVADKSGPADHTDSSLINAWGIAFHPDGFAWVADNGTGEATAYDGLGNKKVEITIPPPAGSLGTAAPTGIVFNDSSDFVVTGNDVSGPSAFIFATEDGTISGWNSDIDAAHAVLAVDNSSTGAVYKGIAIAANGTDRFLYATDFHNNKIDVFDKDFRPTTLSCSFVDHRMPAGFAPFGIHNVRGNLYVTYAKQDAVRHDDVAGKGLGVVDVYNANGCLIRRMITRGQLNAPWGIAVAPTDFGKFSNTLLISNFGDGLINAYDMVSGHFQGALREAKGKPLGIDGLWGIAFGNGVNNQPINALFFAAGPNDESDGLFGQLEAQ